MRERAERGKEKGRKRGPCPGPARDTQEAVKIRRTERKVKSPEGKCR